MLCFYGNGQTNSTIKAELNDEEKLLTIQQSIEYHNVSNDTLTEIHLMDWANAFVDKTTPLAVRFNEDYRRAFHFSKPDERGNTEIYSLLSGGKPIDWNRLENNPDVITLHLNDPLAPKQSINFTFKYNVKIAHERFTDYGYSNIGYKLRYWHLAPALYTDKWESFSHKNLNDFTAGYCNYNVELNTADKEQMESNLTIDSSKVTKKGYRYHLSGKHLSNIQLYLASKANFHSTSVEGTKISTDIPFNGISEIAANECLQKVFKFTTEYYGIPPQSKITLDYSEYKKQPIYGFNQLPHFLRPFEKEFQFEMISLKLLARTLGRQNFQTNLRTEQWITDALQVYVMMKYIETYYPDSKLAGRLHKVFGLRWFHSTQVPFNDQYYLGYKNMSARFLQQKLTTPKDSLLKYNYNISNPYKAGMGLNYLETFIGSKEAIKTSINKLTNENKLGFINGQKLIESLKKSTDKDITWYTNKFIDNNNTVDVKIKGLKRTKDSITVTLKNKGKPVPVTLTGLKNKKVVSTQWTPVLSDTLSFKYPRSQFDQFVVDYNEKLPEVSRRNNYHKTKGILSKNIQFRLFQDVEDPKYHQIFIIPDWSYNVYDGFLIGGVFHNKSFIRRNLFVSLAPKYGALSNKVLGSMSVSYSYQFREHGWYLLTAGAGASTSSYAENLLFRRYTPSINMSYRPKDLRSNFGQSVSLKYTSIQREENPNVPLPSPNYNVLSAKYKYGYSYLNKVLAFGFEFQGSKDFNKIIGTFNYRKLFLNNQQVNFRLYAGSFINNKTTTENGNFFSFALDRPTDYLFQYSYLTRDDDSGLASQEFITAEGNFKSQLNVRFANEWMITSTLESSIWNWIYAYADGGWVKNKYSDPLWQYDTGIKLNLVQDYFELFFPLQSSLGFEPSLSNYHERIRFKATLSFDTLIKLFTREWY